MATLREYIVCLNKGVDYDQFWDEIENESSEDGFVPSRRVDIINERVGSLRSCHYALSDEEAELLKKDSRVYCAELAPSERPDYLPTHMAIQTGNFNKTTDPGTGDYLNWGMIRHNAPTNVYGTSLETALSYEYNYNGTGVDVVISDSGIQVDHPEFKDSLGNSRVQLIDWFAASGVPGTQSSNHYRDRDGHGTHVAGTVAGLTYGWAKNSHIYSIKVRGLEGETDGATGIDGLTHFDILKLWHRNKPVDPVTGHKRPTVVNMSWGYDSRDIFIPLVPSGPNGADPVGGVYRGIPWSGNTFNSAYGTILYNGFTIRTFTAAVDVALEELIDEGVIVCVAAGNNGMKIDVPGGPDYNNYFYEWFLDPNTQVLTRSIDYYYHQGMSPYSDTALIVGSIKTTPYSASLDRKVEFSCSGPGVDLYAAGNDIYSATSNVSRTDISNRSAPYYLNSAYKQASISGTSMATPQVTGVIALYLQKNPTATPAQVKNWLLTNATTTMYETGLDNDYADEQSIMGGEPLVLFTSNELITGQDETPGTVATTWRIRRLRHLRAYKRLARILEGT